MSATWLHFVLKCLNFPDCLLPRCKDTLSKGMSLRKNSALDGPLLQWRLHRAAHTHNTANDKDNFSPRPDSGPERSMDCSVRLVIDGDKPALREPAISNISYCIQSIAR